MIAGCLRDVVDYQRFVCYDLSGACRRCVVVAFAPADVLLQYSVLGGREGPVKEALAYVVDCLIGRVAHVFSIEAIVTKLVHYDFISGKVVGKVEWLQAEVDRTSFQKLLDPEKQGRLADLVAMGSVLEVADRAYGEDELLGSTLDKSVPDTGDFPQSIGYIIDVQSVTHEFLRDMFETVGYSNPGFQMPEAPARSERDDDLVTSHEKFPCLKEF